MIQFHFVLQVNSDTLKSSKYSEAVLAVWTKESLHNYENNARIHDDFVCPSATKFVVEFDSRCRTERRCVHSSSVHDHTGRPCVCVCAGCSSCHGCSTSPPISPSRYDYLQFTDASGQKHQFDETVGTERWPKVWMSVLLLVSMTACRALSTDGRVPWSQASLVLSL